MMNVMERFIKKVTATQGASVFAILLKYFPPAIRAVVFSSINCVEMFLIQIDNIRRCWILLFFQCKLWQYYFKFSAMLFIMPVNDIVNFCFDDAVSRIQLLRKGFTEEFI